MAPFEQLSQRPGIKKARGRVLVGGLGMGWALRELALRKSVKHLSVVENSIPLLDWFGRDLVKKIGEETGREIEIVVDDAYKAADRLFGEVDSFIFDIWKSYGAARADYRWQIVAERAREAKKVAWGWGASGAPRRGEDDDDWGY
jgi:spermidine synthase